LTDPVPRKFYYIKNPAFAKKKKEEVEESFLIVLTLYTMGGPCMIRKKVGGETTRGPECTDNFQIREFSFDAFTYFSCEHAYQALKFGKGSDAWKRVRDIKPGILS
jgi:hypothetical protein